MDLLAVIAASIKVWVLVRTEELVIFFILRVPLLVSSTTLDKPVLKISLSDCNITVASNVPPDELPVVTLPRIICCPLATIIGLTLLVFNTCILSSLEP